MTVHEVQSSQVQPVQCPDRDGKRLKGSRQDLGREFDVCDTTEQIVHLVAIWGRELTYVDTIPHFVFKYSARCEGLEPEFRWRVTKFIE